MTRWAALVVAATTFLAAAPSAGAVPTRTQTYRRLMYEVSIGEFVAARTARNPATFNWTSDGCSTPSPIGLGDTGRSFNFRAACQHHDFGYRNAKSLGLWNSSERVRIDQRFLADMRTDCAPRPITQRPTCQVWATIYYNAVRVAGGP